MVLSVARGEGCTGPTVPGIQLRRAAGKGLRCRDADTWKWKENQNGFISTRSPTPFVRKHACNASIPSSIMTLGSYIYTYTHVPFSANDRGASESQSAQLKKREKKSGEKREHLGCQIWGFSVVYSSPRRADHELSVVFFLRVWGIDRAPCCDEGSPAYPYAIQLAVAAACAGAILKLLFDHPAADAFSVTPCNRVRFPAALPETPHL